MPNNELVESVNAIHQRHNDASEAILDILGVGFGPSNLSLAIAIEENNQSQFGERPVGAKFIEAKTQFGWHNGMMLPDTTMQISFLKDLVSLRSPTSPYSFLNYLHERNRLSDFINLKTFFPTRREFYDYLRWAAQRISIPVVYGLTATRIDWQGGCFVVTTVRSTGGSAMAETIKARNIVIGAGLRPVLPDGIVASRRIFHNHDLLFHLESMPSRTNKSFLVVGAGQSAAEVASYLYNRFVDAEVHASFRRFGYSPSDDTPYVNRIFDPSSVDDFYTAPEALKRRLMAYHMSTNYSAVDADLIEDLYRREYDESVRGIKRLHMHRTTEVVAVKEDEEGVAVTLNDLGSRYSRHIKVDAVVFATGFAAFDTRTLFGTTIDTTSCFNGNFPVVDRDYSLLLPRINGRIFLNGGVQNSHGLTSSLLSNVAIRSADILNAIAAEGLAELSTRFSVGA